jgi:hypothetical protein
MHDAAPRFRDARHYPKPTPGPPTSPSRARGPNTSAAASPPSGPSPPIDGSHDRCGGFRLSAGAARQPRASRRRVPSTAPGKPPVRASADDRFAQFHARRPHNRVGDGAVVGLWTTARRPRRVAVRPGEPASAIPGDVGAIRSGRPGGSLGLPYPSAYLTRTEGAQSGTGTELVSLPGSSRR